MVYDAEYPTEERSTYDLLTQLEQLESEHNSQAIRLCVALTAALIAKHTRNLDNIIPITPRINKTFAGYDSFCEKIFEKGASDETLRLCDNLLQDGIRGLVTS